MEEISEMGSSQNVGKTEGWLYLVRFNRFGLQYTRKRYFVLENNVLNCFKSQPTSKNEGSIRSAFIDSCIRVMDNGRENINKNVFFIFTLYNSSKHSDQLKLGARSSEEMAKWIHSLKKSALMECPDREQNNSTVASSKRRWPPFRLNRNRRRSCMSSVDWTVFSSIDMDPYSSDVIAPSPWTIFGCKNGLRLFKEASDGDFHGKSWNAHPAIMAVGVVDATSEDIFRTIMSLGPSRSEWDFCFACGSIVEHLDGHTDIVNKQLKEDWLPWGMRRRDLLFRRYWRREDDGTYVILYHSVLHEKCRPQKGFVRACLKSGGYVISPIKRGRQSVVKHMLAIDWKFWRSCFFNSTEKYVTISMLGKIAALRELFKAKLENRPAFDFSTVELLPRDVGISPNIEEIKEEIPTPMDGVNTENDAVKLPLKLPPSSEQQIMKPLSGGETICGSLVQLNDAADVFFDVPEQSEIDGNDKVRLSDMCMGPQPQPQRQQDQKHNPRLPTPADFVKKLHSLAAQRKFHVALQETGTRGRCNYGTTLPKDPTCTMPCSWTEADPSSFLIRGENYLQDHHKIKATNTLMKMVAADWLKSDKREDDLGAHPTGIVQKYAAQGGNEFFIIINIQVPGTTTTHNLALYYLMNTPVETVPLLESFVKGDDAYRNSRFKLIPHIPKGSWIVKQSVGKKACLVGQALEINYFHGSNYLELGIDIGSSTVARGVVNLVLGYINNLVIEMAFLIQANNPEELPEMLLGTCQLNHLDVAKSFSARP